MKDPLPDIVMSIYIAILLGMFIFFFTPASTAQCEWGYTYGVTP